jgi:hypothetical protein
LVEFPRFSLVDISAGKMEYPIRPRGLSEEKTREKHGEKKGAENDLPYTYGDATSGDVISSEVTINLTINLKYYPDST